MKLQLPVERLYSPTIPDECVNPFPGRQAVGQASELLQNVAPQTKEAASNLYERGLQSREYARQYTMEQPLTALLIAGAIGYGLGYLIHRR
jgi:ElaB/YqjD/DUF883 family membrane-anchored ribosome-binding protein